MNVDGLQIEGLVADMYRQITRAIRTFQEFPSNLIIWWLSMKVVVESRFKNIYSLWNDVKLLRYMSY